MKVLIIGSGLIGVSAAFALRARGHDVIVLDRAAGPGLETSFANGGLLTPSMSDPWNAPGCWRVLLKSLARSDSPLQLRWRSLPSLAPWGISFLLNSKSAIYERSALSNLRLALYSREVLRSLREQTGVDYGHNDRGSLRIFRDAASLQHAASTAHLLAVNGLQSRKLSPAEAVDIEPALKPIAAQLAGAIHYADDEAGDAHRFCVGLAEQARGSQVEFRFGVEISKLEMQSGRIAAVVAAGERVVADHYLVAAGSHSAGLLRGVGVSIPVRPVKGYSLTFEDSRASPSLAVPIIDDQLHAVVTPFQGAIRAAGTAEFAGFNLTLDRQRIENLERLVAQVLPHAALDRATAKPWCGLRPMSVDGVPLIGATPLANLWVSTGHGPLGWTLAAGSARLLTDLMSGAAPAIDPAPYAPSRFF